MNHPTPAHDGCSARRRASCAITTTKTRSKNSSRNVTRRSAGRSANRAGGLHSRRAALGLSMFPTFLRLSGCRPLERREQDLGFVRVVVPDAVDVEGRCPVHAAPHAVHEVLVDPGLVHVLRHLLVEPLDVQSELLRIPVEIWIGQVTLALVQQVMHLPESALRIGGFCCLGRVLRMWM